MAYGNIYWAGFKTESLEGVLYIDKLDYVGTTSKLILEFNDFTLRYNFTDWETPIIPLQVEFSIVNDKSDYFELSTLMYAEEREYKIRLVISTVPSYTAFDGFINCEPISQKYLHFSIIDLTASNYLLKLEFVTPPSINTLQNLTFIDIINECLQLTGSTFPILVNNTIHAEGDVPTAAQTLFNKNGVFTELFWDDEIERKNGYDIVTTILKTFNCYLYWWMGSWYIEHYDNLWQESIDYVQYEANSQYSPTSSGTVVNKAYTISDLNNFVFTNRTQQLQVNPGIKNVTIDLMDERFINLINPNFQNYTLDSVNPVVPNYRECRLWDTSVGGQMEFITWSNVNVPHNTIQSAICRTISDYGILNYWKGIFYTFKSTIISKEDSFSISYKYEIDPTTLGVANAKIKDFNFKFHWYLRVLPDTDYIGNLDESWNVYFAELEQDWLQIVEVDGSDFDEDTNTITISVSIPIGKCKKFQVSQDKGYLRGDYTFVLCVGAERMSSKTSTEFEIDPWVAQPRTVWFGDITVTSSGENQDNQINGTANTKYLNKLVINLDLYDSKTFDYKNAILRGDSLEFRTTNWGTTGGDVEIIARGVCWSSVNNQPTIADSKSVDGTGYGDFISQMVDLTPNTVYYYRAYATTALGGTSYGETLLLTTNALEVGHLFQGGLIGYIFQPGDAGYQIGETHGIIVSVEDQDTRMFWGRLSGGGPYTCGAYGFEIGDGATNTAAIEANTFQNDFAIRKIVDYVYAGYTDWFLPSIVELVKLYANRKMLGLAADWYWSSTEEPGSWKIAWAVNMGGVNNYGEMWKKNNYMRTRACRYF